MQQEEDGLLLDRVERTREGALPAFKRVSSVADVSDLNELIEVGARQPSKQLKSVDTIDESQSNAVDTVPIVMLRGLGRGKHHWASFKDELRKAFPQRDILLIDLPGNGELAHLESPSTIKAAAESITTQLELQGVKGPCDFIGLSLGGMIVMYLMGQTAWVRKACVINTSLGALNLPLQRMKPVAALNLLYSLFLPKRMQEKVVWHVTANKPKDLAVIKNWVTVAHLNQVSLRNFWRQIQVARTFNQRLFLGSKSQDLLVLASKKDDLVSYRCSQNLSKHTKSEIKLHKSAGHDLPLDEPAWVASCVYQKFRV